MDDEKNSLLAATKEGILSGNFAPLISLLSKSKFSKSKVDAAFRLYLRSFQKHKKDEALVPFIEKSDLNYQNPNEKNTTILMTLIEIKESFFFETFIKYQFNTALQDSDGNNIVHYLVKSDFKELTIILILKMLHNIPKIDINTENLLGEFPLSIAFSLGLSKIADELISLGADTKKINKLTGDSLLHYAVNGKNPSCVVLLSDLDPNYCNYKSFSPIDIAKKLGLEQIMKILSSFNSSSKGREIISPLTLFMEGNYKTVIRFLDNPTDCLSMTNDNSWNIFLNQLKLDLLDYNCSPAPIKEKLSAYFNDKSKIPQNASIYNYNKAIYFFNLGNYPVFVRLMKEAIKQSTLPILTINFYILLFEYYSFFRYSKQALDCLNKIKEILQVDSTGKITNESFINSKNVHDETSQYLESVGLISSPEEDSVPLLNLYQALYSQLILNHNGSKTLLTEFKRTIVSSSKVKRLLFNHFSFIYSCMKLKNDYYSNSFSKFYTNSIKLYESFENSVYFGQKTKIYYQNKNGIMNLRMKNFELSEYHFKQCLHNLNSIKYTNSLLTWHRDFNAVRYNLALVYFFKREFREAYNILMEIKNHVHRNLYFYYRLGLCCLEIFNEENKEDNDITTIYLGQGTSEVKRIILQSSSKIMPNNQKNSYLKQAILCFKQSIINLKGYGDSEDTDSNSEVCSKISIVLCSCYLNLIFCLIINKSYRESLFYINEIEAQGVMTEENVVMLDNYKIKAYINLSNFQAALETIKKSLNSISLGKANNLID